MRFYAPEFLQKLPDWLAPVNDLPSATETSECSLVRKPFLVSGEGEPFMVDVIRARRLIRGAKRYIEVGTWDKGCLAYNSTLLDRSAHLIDVDIDSRPDSSKALRAFLPVTQKLTTIVGDSTAAETLGAVREALGDSLADAAFIDGNHAADYAWADFVNFSKLVRPGGLLLFHDIYWNGEGTTVGTSRAMEQMDRFTPVYAVFGSDPVHRYQPYFAQTPAVWGGVGIIRPR